REPRQGLSPGLLRRVHDRLPPRRHRLDLPHCRHPGGRRALMRALAWLRTLKQERIRVANRMNGLLANQGLWLPPGTDVGAAAKTVRLWDGSPVPAALRARLEREWEHAQFLRTRIRELERERQRAIAHGHGEAIDKVRQLLRLRAVGPTGAWVYVNEFFGWRRF